MLKKISIIFTATVAIFNVGFTQQKIVNPTAANILGNPKYKAICYGGYRQCNRDSAPTIAQIKEDLKILAVLNYKILRTYNVHKQEISNILEAITQLKKEQKQFEMYVMLGAWIDCKNAWTNLPPIHNEESERNAVEVAEAVRLANKYPSIIKIISVGNEARVTWATSYFVTTDIILKWVKHLQQLKKTNQLSKDVWITSSDNFAPWGGGETSYHSKELVELIKAVDYVSIHTYPMHDTHYNPTFWGVKANEKNLSQKEQINAIMLRAKDYAINQYNSVVQYIRSNGIKKAVHIGETGWATQCNELYGNNGSKAIDEYKAAIYHQLISEWATKQKISCFYFEAFDECWKNGSNPMHSENHFGFINLNGKAKYALWRFVDKGVFKSLTRDGKTITKTYDGNEVLLMKEVQLPTSILKN